MKNLKTLYNCCDNSTDGAGILDAVSNVFKEDNAAEVSVAQVFFVGQKVEVYCNKEPYLLKGKMEITKVPRPKSGSNILRFKRLLKGISAGDLLVVTNQEAAQ